MTQDITTQVAVLRNDVERFSTFFSKLDIAIEKISEVNGSISQILAVHEERINHNAELTERRATETLTVFKLLEEKILEIRDEKLDELRADIIDEYTEKCAVADRIIAKRFEKLEEKVEKADQFKWIMLGGAVALGAFGYRLVNLLPF